MSRVLLLIGLSLGACSKGPQADLQYIKQARSLAAEQALVNELDAAGKVTPTYVESMHKWLRDNLGTTSSSLTQPNSPYGEEIQKLMAEPDGASPDQLRSHVEKLKQIEDRLESA